LSPILAACNYRATTLPLPLKLKVKDRSQSSVSATETTEYTETAFKLSVVRTTQRPMRSMVMKVLKIMMKIVSNLKA
jgi:hypothetical protein